VVCKGHSGEVIYVAFNSHGDLLASTSFDGSTRFWDPWTGKQLLHADGAAGDFSRDDHWLGLEVVGPQVGRWEVADGRECRRFHIPKSGRSINGVAASSNGHWLAAASADGVSLWNLGSG